MAVGSMTFPMLSWEQTNPAMTGVQQGTKSIADILQNQKAKQLIEQQRIANKYLEPMTQEALKQQQYETQIKAPQAQYAPQMTLADLMYKQAQTPYIKAQTGLIGEQAKLYPELTREQINEMQSKAKWLPYQAMGDYARGLGSYGMSQYYSTNPISLIRSLQSPQVESLYQTSPEFATDVANALASMASRTSSMYGGQPSSASLPTLEQAIRGEAFGQPQDQQATKPIFTPEQISQSQKTTGDILSKRATTANIMNQRQYAKNLDEMLAASDKLMPSVIKYSGLLGGAKGSIEKAKSALGGETSDDFINFNNFVSVDVPYMAGEISRTLGKNATDMEQKLLLDLANPDQWYSNPKLAMSKWNRLITMASNTAKALSMPATDVVADLQTGGTASKILQGVEQQTDDPLGIR